MRFALALAVLLGTSFSPAALAQDDDLDDILGSDDTQPRTAGEERQSLLDESDAPKADTSADTERRVIKTLQRKSFRKVDYWEANVGGGFITNDPFLNRYLVTGGVTYHVTEIFAVEPAFTFSPDLGESDYKPITNQIIEKNQVTPDISKIQFYGNLNFQFSPIYGKAAIFGKKIINFDLFGVFGTGIVNTKDDLVALDAEDDPKAQATESQIHPTLNYGGGARIMFSQLFAFRVEARGISYVEVLESTTLEMKNNMSILATASFFVGGKKQ